MIYDSSVLLSHIFINCLYYKEISKISSVACSVSFLSHFTVLLSYFNTSCEFPSEGIKLKSA